MSATSSLENTVFGVLSCAFAAFLTEKIMGDSSKDKTGDSSVDKMYEILSKLLEQQQQQKLVPEAVKYALEPNPVRLSGPGNYVSWARHAQLILSSHGYEDLIIDDVEQKKTDISAKQINDRVLVWILGSMEPIVRQQVEIMTNVYEVWAALEKQFAGKSNKMQATRIMDELTHLKQGSKSVTEYAGEVKRLYRDLHYYHPFQPVDKKDLDVHHKWFESLVAKLFLDGLNQELNLRRQLIFSQQEWPNLDDIICSVIEEETRLAQCKENEQRCTDRAAFSMHSRRVPRSFNKTDKSKLFCDHCRKNGHTIDMCFELHGYPPWWDEKGRSRTGGVQGANKRHAIRTAFLQKQPLVDVRPPEEFSSKLRISESSPFTHDASKPESSLMSTSHPGARDREIVGDRNRA